MTEKKYTCKTWDEVQTEVNKLGRKAERNGKYPEYIRGVLGHISGCKTIQQCNAVLENSYKRVEK